MARRHPLNRQRGAALLVFLVFLTMGTAAWLVNSFDPASIESRRQQQTEMVLRQARDAVLAYMLKFRDEENSHGQAGRMYGYLPMPDLGTSRNGNIGCRTNPSDASTEQEGCEANTPDGLSTTDPLPTLVGRLPWRTLGIEPLRDGYGECLWLIVASPHLGGNSWRSGTLEMNWDTLGQFDVVSAQGNDQLVSRISHVHDRPVAVIFAPGPRLPNQNRGTLNASDDVTHCGGNYDARNYLDPWSLEDLNSLTNYFDPSGTTTNHASGTTGNLQRDDDPDTAKSLTIQGSIVKDGSNYIAGGCKNKDCKSNDLGLSINNTMIFSSLRNHSYFRSDINSLLATVGNHLSSNPPSSLEPLNPTTDSTRFGKLTKNEAGIKNIPSGYFQHYAEELLYGEVVSKASCSFASPENCFQVTLFDQPTIAPQIKYCPAVLVLGSERNDAQRRVTQSDRHNPGNYLEGVNLSAFTQTSINSLIGAQQFERPRVGRLKSQDVVRCLPESGYSESNPSGAQVISVQNTLLGDTSKQLTRYTQNTDTITLGQEYSGASSPVNAELYGCVWETESRALLTGFRTYFKFKINDPATTTDNALEGFTLAMVDADINGPGACGASLQHIGFSGSNGDTPPLQPPKIGLEFDLRLQGPTYPTTSTNRRNDPSYTGGHFGWIYWGTDTDVNDDNVHGRGGPVLSCPPTPPETYVTEMPPPLNPTAPSNPTLGDGVYKLNPSLSGVPLNQEVHVRVELTRSASAPSSSLPAVRVATTSNINLASPGEEVDGVKVVNIDGVELSPKDRVLVRAQSLPNENGIYIVNGPETAMSRADDFDTPPELAGAVIEVAEGIKYALTTWHQAATTPAIGLSALAWTQVPVKLAIDNMVSTIPGFNALQGFPLQRGDRILVKQGSNSGIWSWQGATNPMQPIARPSPSCSSELETCLQTGASVRVSKGTDNNIWMRYDGTAWLPVAQASIAPQRNIDLTSNEKPTDGCLEPGTNPPYNLVLLRFQTDAKENGLYEWSGGSLTKSSTPMQGAIVQVRQGTDMGRAFRQTIFQQTGDSTAFGPLDPVFSTGFTVQAWVLKDSATDADRIAIMKDTSRPMKMLEIGLTSPPFPPHVSNLTNIYHPFRQVQLGFTLGQRRLTSRNNDQTILITDRASTWLP